MKEKTRRRQKKRKEKKGEADGGSKDKKENRTEEKKIDYIMMRKQKIYIIYKKRTNLFDNISQTYHHTASKSEPHLQTTTTPRTTIK